MEILTARNYRPGAFYPPSAGGSVIILDPKETALLATMIGQDVIGSTANGTGIADALNSGLEYEDLYWDDDSTFVEVLIFARDLLKGLHLEQDSIDEADGFITMSIEAANARAEYDLEH